MSSWITHGHMISRINVQGLQRYIHSFYIQTYDGYRAVVRCIIIIIIIIMQYTASPLHRSVNSEIFFASVCAIRYNNAIIIVKYR